MKKSMNFQVITVCSSVNLMIASVYLVKVDYPIIYFRIITLCIAFSLVLEFFDFDCQ